MGVSGASSRIGAFTMTLAAKLEDFEVTLEHLLMDVFVSKGFPLFCTTDPLLHPRSLQDSVPIPD